MGQVWQEISPTLNINEHHVCIYIYIYIYIMSSDFFQSQIVFLSSPWRIRRRSRSKRTTLYWRSNETGCMLVNTVPPKHIENKCFFNIGFMVVNIGECQWCSSLCWIVTSGCILGIRQMECFQCFQAKALQKSLEEISTQCHWLVWNVFVWLVDLTYYWLAIYC
jgi:hypothetical protein